MKAVTWHGVGDIRLEDVPDPKIAEPTDAIVKITTSAICGTDLHLVRGTLPGMSEGTVLGHEAVGEVVEVGHEVRNFSPGDRVVVPSTIGCGYCSYCRAGYPAMCDNSNPQSRQDTAFFGGPRSSGSIDGLQAEYARVPYAYYSLTPVPMEVSEAQAIACSDIFPTAWFGARLAEVGEGDTVAVFGAGPVGQLSMLSACLQGAGRVFAVDHHDDRLALARLQHAETINFDAEDPVASIRDMTGGIGVDRVIDAVGVEAEHPRSGPAVAQATQHEPEFAAERQAVAAQAHPKGDTWVPGDAPSQALRWSVESAAKAGSVGVVGAYPATMNSFPFGEAFAKNLTIKAGSCNHRRYLPRLVNMIAEGEADPSVFVTQHEPMNDAIAAYGEFDRREPGWIKVSLDPVV